MIDLERNINSLSFFYYEKIFFLFSMLEIARQEELVQFPSSSTSNIHFQIINPYQLAKQEEIYNSQQCFMNPQQHCQFLPKIEVCNDSENSLVFTTYGNTADISLKETAKEENSWIKKDSDETNDIETMDFSNNEQEKSILKKVKKESKINAIWDPSVALLPTPKERLKNCRERAYRGSRNHFKNSSDMEFSPEKRRSEGKIKERDRRRECPRRRAINEDESPPRQKTIMHDISDEDGLKPIDLSSEDDHISMEKSKSLSTSKYNEKNRKENTNIIFSQIFRAQMANRKKQSSRSKSLKRSNKKNISKSSSSEDS